MIHANSLVYRVSKQGDRPPSVRIIDYWNCRMEIRRNTTGVTPDDAKPDSLALSIPGSDDVSTLTNFTLLKVNTFMVSSCWWPSRTPSAEESVSARQLPRACFINWPAHQGTCQNSSIWSKLFFNKISIHHCCQVQKKTLFFFLVLPRTEQIPRTPARFWKPRLRNLKS